MSTTIREQLNKGNVPISASSFAGSGDALLDFPLAEAASLEWRPGTPMDLLLKNKAKAMPLEAAEQQLGISIPELPRQMPWFCSNLEALRDAREQGRPIAVEGGPCLFGVYEVLAEVTTAQSGRHRFDYSIGRCQEQTLSDYLREHAPEITGLTFLDQKKGMTAQERDSIRWLFAAAHALKARVVLPLPDMSYIKYLAAIVQPLSDQVAQQALQQFTCIAHRIAQLYIQLTQEIARQYSDVPYTIVHDMDIGLCTRYYEMRDPFVSRRRVLTNLTAFPEKRESVKDYITMPALPYYLFGIRDILQIDNLTELDSYRKCCQMHKKKLNIGCLLYPERLSADGIHTIFYASPEYKEYL